jgi:hypothetical protein
MAFSKARFLKFGDDHEGSCISKKDVSQLQGDSPSGRGQGYLY